jgi:hypothetical protein
VQGMGAGWWRRPGRPPDLGRTGAGAVAQPPPPAHRAQAGRPREDAGPARVGAHGEDPLPPPPKGPSQGRRDRVAAGLLPGRRAAPLHSARAGQCGWGGTSKLLADRATAPPRYHIHQHHHFGGARSRRASRARSRCSTPCTTTCTCGWRRARPRPQRPPQLRPLHRDHRGWAAGRPSSRPAPVFDNRTFRPRRIGKATRIRPKRSFRAIRGLIRAARVRGVKNRIKLKNKPKLAPAWLRPQMKALQLPCHLGRPCCPFTPLNAPIYPHKSLTGRNGEMRLS